MGMVRIYEGRGRKKDILNTREVAKLLGISPISVIRYVKKGIIPGQKVAGWRFSREAVIKALDTYQGKVEPGGEPLPPHQGPGE